MTEALARSGPGSTVHISQIQHHVHNRKLHAGSCVLTHNRHLKLSTSVYKCSNSAAAAAEQWMWRVPERAWRPPPLHSGCGQFSQGWSDFLRHSFSVVVVGAWAETFSCVQGVVKPDEDVNEHFYPHPTP